MANTETNPTANAKAEAAVAQTAQQLENVHNEKDMAKVFQEFREEAKDQNAFRGALNQMNGKVTLPKELKLDGFQLTDFSPEENVLLVAKESADKKPEKTQYRVVTVDGSEYQGTLRSDGTKVSLEIGKTVMADRQSLLVGGTQSDANRNAQPQEGKDASQKAEAQKAEKKQAKGNYSEVEKKHRDEIAAKILADPSSVSLPVQRTEGYFQVLQRMHKDMDGHDLAVAAHRIKWDLNGGKNELKVGDTFRVISEEELNKKVDSVIAQEENEAAQKAYNPHSNQVDPTKDQQKDNGTTIRFDAKGKPVEVDYDDKHSSIVRRDLNDPNEKVDGLADLHGNLYETRDGGKTWAAQDKDGKPIADPPGGAINGIEMDANGNVTISRSSGKATDVIGADGATVKSDSNGNAIRVDYKDGQHSTTVLRGTDGAVEGLTDAAGKTYTTKDGKWITQDADQKVIADPLTGPVSGIKMDQTGVVTISRSGKAEDVIGRDGLMVSHPDYDGEPKSQADGSVVKCKKFGEQDQVVEVDYKGGGNSIFHRTADGTLEGYTDRYGSAYTRSDKGVWLLDGKPEETDPTRGAIKEIDVDQGGATTITRAAAAKDVFLSDGSAQYFDQVGKQIYAVHNDGVQLKFDGNGRPTEVYSKGGRCTHYEYFNATNPDARAISISPSPGAAASPCVTYDGKYHLKDPSDDKGNDLITFTKSPKLDATTGDLTITTDDNPPKTIVYQPDGKEKGLESTSENDGKAGTIPEKNWVTNKDLGILPDEAQGTATTDAHGNDLTTWTAADGTTITRTYSKKDGSGVIRMGDGTKYTFGYDNENQSENQSGHQRRYIEKWFPAQDANSAAGEMKVPPYGIKKYDDGSQGFADGTRVIQTEIDGDDGRKGWQMTLSPDGSVHCGSGEKNYHGSGKRKHGLDLNYDPNRHVYALHAWGPRWLDSQNRTVSDVQILADHAVKDWTTTEHSPLQSCFKLSQFDDWRIKFGANDGDF
jgi:hypothetical protein